MRNEFCFGALKPFSFSCGTFLQVLKNATVLCLQVADTEETRRLHKHHPAASVEVDDQTISAEPLLYVIVCNHIYMNALLSKHPMWYCVFLFHMHEHSPLSFRRLNHPQSGPPAGLT